MIWDQEPTCWTDAGKVKVKWCSGVWPRVVVDELGATGDADAIQMAWNAGLELLLLLMHSALRILKKVGSRATRCKDGFERIVLLGMDNGKRWTR